MTNTNKSTSKIPTCRQIVEESCEIEREVRKQMFYSQDDRQRWPRFFYDSPIGRRKKTDILSYNLSPDCGIILWDSNRESITKTDMYNCKYKQNWIRNSHLSPGRGRISWDIQLGRKDDKGLGFEGPHTQSWSVFFNILFTFFRFLRERTHRPDQFSLKYRVAF